VDAKYATWARADTVMVQAYVLFNYAKVMVNFILTVLQLEIITS
jgi:hypothetical protein